jgi:hypothetical protein
MIGKGQVVPWTVIPTSVSQEIVLEKVDSTVSYDFTFNTLGDAIGIFYDQSGTWVCAGYLQLDGITKTFTVYGNDAVDNGFQNLEMYHLMYWRKSQNCIIDMPASGWSNAQYSTGGSDTILVLGALPAIVKYPKEYYCRKNSAVQSMLVQITGTTAGNLNFNFPSGMTNGSDPVTGNIEDFSQIISGTYNIPISTDDNMCLRNTSINITLSEKLSSSPIIDIIQPNCIDLTGIIRVDTATIINGTKPYIIGLKNMNNGVITFSPRGVFLGVTPDEYQLTIQDLHNCADTITISIQFPTDCEKVNDILTPLQNSNFAEVFLPWVGLTKIYNSQGQQIHSFTTPAIWDGKDQYGRYVPTGAYFIFTEGKKKKEITVVY